MTLSRHCPILQAHKSTWARHKHIVQAYLVADSPASMNRQAHGVKARAKQSRLGLLDVFHHLGKAAANVLVRHDDRSPCTDRDAVPFHVLKDGLANHHHLAEFCMSIIVVVNAHVRLTQRYNTGGWIVCAVVVHFLPTIPPLFLVGVHLVGVTDVIVYVITHLADVGDGHADSVLYELCFTEGDFGMVAVHQYLFRRAVVEDRLALARGLLELYRPQTAHVLRLLDDRQFLYPNQIGQLVVIKPGVGFLLLVVFVSPDCLDVTVFADQTITQPGLEKRDEVVCRG